MIRTIPKKYKGLGVKLYCNRCKREVNEKCALTTQRSKQCPNKDSWVYKCIVHIPVAGTQGRKKSKVLVADNIEDAILEANQFKSDIRHSRNVARHQEQENTLRRAIQSFLQHKDSEGAFSSRSRNLTIEHQNDIRRVLRRFTDSLRICGLDPDSIDVNDLKSTVLEPFYSIVNEYVSSDAGKDKHTRIMRSFLRYCIDLGMYKGGNFFKVVPVGEIVENPISIDDLEFEEVLRVVKPENGRCLKKRKNLYQDWLITAFKIARYTGLRREELYEIRWKNVLSVGDEQEVLIVPNFKVQRQKSKQGILKVVPIFGGLKEVIIELKASQKEDGRIIDTDYSLKYFCDLLSRSFTHFYSIAFPGDRPKTFKHLRKTHLTDLATLLGADAHLLTGHTTNAVLDSHYIDKIRLAKRLAEIDARK